MIARIWQGSVPKDKGERYIALMRQVAIPDYHGIASNRGAWCLSRAEDDLVHIEMLTFWDSLDVIRAFAGDDIDRAKYYHFDPDYLIEMVPTVRHFTVADA